MLSNGALSRDLEWPLDFKVMPLFNTQMSETSRAVRVKCPNSGHFFEIALNTVIFSMQRDCLV